MRKRCVSRQKAVDRQKIGLTNWARERHSYDRPRLRTLGLTNQPTKEAPMKNAIKTKSNVKAGGLNQTNHNRGLL